MKKKKVFWVYIILIFLIYLGLFFYIRSNISGSFFVETYEIINFDELKERYDIGINEKFALDINYLEGYIFSDNTELFDIGRETGIISFTPTSMEEYSVVIVALHDVDDLKVKVVTFNIT